MTFLAIQSDDKDIKENKKSKRNKGADSAKVEHYKHVCVAFYIYFLILG